MSVKVSKRLFTEDDVLCNGKDPDYPGIKGWWSDQFNRDFQADWIYAAPTEVDGGDAFTRTITLDGKRYYVTYSFDGYHVDA